MSVQRTLPPRRSLAAVRISGLYGGFHVLEVGGGGSPELEHGLGMISAGTPYSVPEGHQARNVLTFGILLAGGLDGPCVTSEQPL